MDLSSLIEAAVARIHRDLGDDVLGILVTGSYIHGTPAPTSDLDVHVLIRSPRRRRWNFVVHGVEIETFVNPLLAMDAYFRDPRGLTAHMLAAGQIVYDPEGAMATLQQKARAIWEAGPAPLSARPEWTYRYTPADLLRDLADVGDSDPAQSVWLTVQVVEQLLNTLAQAQGRWPAKLKRRLAELDTWAPEAARLARHVLLATSAEARLQHLDALAALVLAPCGGLMPLEWTMPWQPLGDSDDDPDSR